MSRKSWRQQLLQMKNSMEMRLDCNETSFVWNYIEFIRIFYQLPPIVVASHQHDEPISQPHSELMSILTAAEFIRIVLVVAGGQEKDRTQTVNRAKHDNPENVIKTKCVLDRPSAVCTTQKQLVDYRSNESSTKNYFIQFDIVNVVLIACNLFIFSTF